MMQHRESAVLYVRVSTASQKAKGASLQTQEQLLRDFCNRAQIPVDSCYREAVSAKGPLAKRTQLRKAIQRAKRLGAPIIVYALDRISRDAAAIEKLARDETIEIWAITGLDGSNPLVIMTEAKKAEMERERISRTTREALARRKAEGMLLGNRTNLPEAQRAGREAAQRKADEHARELLPLVQSLHERGIRSLGAVARELNAREIPTARGGKWYPATVRNLLKRAGQTQPISAVASAHDDATEGYADDPHFGSW